MKVTGSSVEQLEKGKPKGKCKKWRLWVSTELGRKSKRFTGTWTQATQALAEFVEYGEIKNQEAENKTEDPKALRDPGNLS